MFDAIDKKACVVVVNYESESALVNLLSDIACYDNKRVFLVDNSDKSPLNKDFFFPGIDLEVITPRKNLGFGAGCNLGLKKAFGEGYGYAFLVNPDVRFDGDVFDQMLAGYVQEKSSKVVAVPTIVFDDDPESIWYAGGEITPLLLRATVNNYMGVYNPAEFFGDNEDVGFASGCFMLLSKEVFELTGGFDERIFLYEEDVDFSIRCRSLDISLKYFPSIVVRHVCQASSRAPGEGFVPILSAENPRLPFYLKNIITSKKILYRNVKSFWGRNLRIFAYKFYLMALLFRYRHRRDVFGIILRGIL